MGAVGVATIMIISVLERRSEIGRRRALGAAESHIRTQFLGESILLAAEAWSAGIASAVLIGAFADLMPAVRASRKPPIVALRTV